MVLDLSSYNGKVDFEKVNKAANIERVILRGTTRNGNIDTRFIENLAPTAARADVSITIAMLSANVTEITVDKILANLFIFNHHFSFPILPSFCASLHLLEFSAPSPSFR